MARTLACLAAVLALASGAPVNTSSSCTGYSSGLPAAECAAWLSIWDHFQLGELQNRGCAAGRTDPCDSPTCAYCSFAASGETHITAIDLGDRGLTGQVPAEFGEFGELRYLMLAYNRLSGTLPKLNYSQFNGCGGSKYVTQGGLQLFHPGPQGQPSARAAWGKGECCYLSSAAEAGIISDYDCPLPDGASDYCNAVCGNTPSPTPTPTPTPSPSPPAPPSSCCYASSSACHRGQTCCSAAGKPLSSRAECAQSGATWGCVFSNGSCTVGTAASNATQSTAQEPAAYLGPPAPSPPFQCNPACKTPSNQTYPLCDVQSSLNFGNATLWRVGGITSAYCNDKYLVVWADGIPNHEVFLEEIPKPPGTNTDQSYPYTGNDQADLRTWQTMNYTYAIPLTPKLASGGSSTKYTGFGAMAMAVNGIPMYPDDSTSGVSTKKDQQLDHCNEHAGKGADVHYHGDPNCMYDNTKPALVGYAGDGFPVYGLLDPDTGKAPTDLDECSGRKVTLGDGTSSYRYHTQIESPFTVACWKGEPPAKWSNGHQWNYDNSFDRTNWQDVWPCCS